MQNIMSQITPMTIFQLYWTLNDGGAGGWKVDSSLRRAYYRESPKANYNLAMPLITYEVRKEFKNGNSIHASITMRFMVAKIGNEPDESENFRCMIICSDALQKYIDDIIGHADYLKVDVTVKEDTQFEPPQPLEDRKINPEQN